MAVRSLCISSAYYPPHLGGVEVFTQSIARELVSRGIAVTVVTDGVDDAGYELTDEGIEIFRMPAADPTGRFPLLGRNGLSRTLWDVLQKTHFDAYVVNTRFYQLSLRMLAIARAKGERPVLIEHGSSYLRLGNPALDAAIRAYEDAIAVRVRAARPICCGVSREACAWLGNFGLQARGCVHNSIDAEAFRACSSGRDFRSELGIAPEERIIAFTGRLIAEKGVRTLAETARMLSGEGFRFLVAGDGPEAEHLQNEAPSNLVLLGRLARPDISALLQFADAFCFPSTYPEGLPTSLLEAAACGSYLITAPVAGAAEIVADATCGAIVSPVDAASFSRTIRDAFADIDAMRAAARRCQLHVERDFSWDKAADDLLAACQSRS